MVILPKMAFAGTVSITLYGCSYWTGEGGGSRKDNVVLFDASLTHSKILG